MKLLLIIELPLLFLDCTGNRLVGGSFMNTLSATAWRARDTKYWFWTHKFINKLFFWQNNHCRGAAAKEDEFGSIWASWLNSWGNG